jgi:C4-dicarboxylate-specific signal transduction histidine kinase
MMQEQLIMCQRLTLLGRLSSGIAHEVNNHLTGVSGYAQLLLSRNESGEIKEQLSKINSSADRCRSLIADMRRIGRFGGSEKELNNINLVIKSCLDLLRPQFAKKSLQIVEQYAQDIPSAEIDTPAFEQAFLSILQNAFEALSENGTTLTVTTLAEDNGWVTAKFEDDGPGLSEEAKKHLFTPFFTTKHRLQCPGLGLAAAKSIIQAHNGIIDVDNMPSRGACVEVRLPCDEKYS